MEEHKEHKPTEGHHKQHNEEHKGHHEHESNDEITIDFSKITKFFKGKSHKGKSSSIFQNPKLYLILLLIIPLFFAYSVRMTNYGIPQTDDWAQNTIENNLRNQITQQINTQYPNLPQQNKQGLVEEQYQKYLSDNKAEIDKAISDASKFYKEYYQFEDGSYYMPDIDPYHFLRYSRNLEEKGHFYDELRDGVPYDNHQIAPLGRPVNPESHSFLLYYLHKIMTIFHKDMTLMQSASYYAIIFSLLSIIPAFFIGRRIGGNTAGFFAAMILAVATAGVNRTLWGHADTDAYNLFFPVLTFWLLLESWMSRGWKNIIFSVLTGLAMGVYSLFWTGWWYVFDFILGTLSAYIIYYLLIYRKEIIGLEMKKPVKHDNIRNSALTLIVFVASTGVFVSLMSSLRTFINAFKAPLNFIFIKSASLGSLWPNVMTTVAELNEANMSSIFGSVSSGYMFLLFIALFGLVLMMYKNEDIEDDEKGIVLGVLGYLLIIWPLSAKASFLFTLILLVIPAAYFIFAKKSIKATFLVTSACFYFLLVKQVNAVSQSLYSSFGTGNGNLIFLILLLLPVAVAFLYMIINKEEQDVMMTLLLTMWFLGTIYASTKGIRFTLLLVPGYAIAVGASIGKLIPFITEYAEKKLEWKFSKAIVVIMFLLLLIGPVMAGYQVGKGDMPIINDVWYNSLTKIKDNSEPDAILTSWWDFGHHFRYFADRAVTFDGASQAQAAHWAGKIFLTDDEDLAVGILRMLDCGSKQGPEVLDEKFNDLSKSVAIIYETLKLDRNEAKEVLLSKGVDAEHAERVLDLTHCKPPEAFVIASEDMIGKSGVWGHFGSWDFERAKIWRDYKNMPRDRAVKAMMDDFGYDDGKAERIYDEISEISDERTANTWIAPWPSYVSGLQICAQPEDNVLLCGQSVMVNLTTNDVQMATQDGLVNPGIFNYFDGDELATKEYPDGTQDYGISLIHKNNQYSAVIAQTPQESSMFTRLFFHEGKGLKHFKLFFHERGITGTEVYVYKVDWDGETDDIADVGDMVSLEYIGYLEDDTLFDSSILGWREMNITPEADFDDFDATKPIEFRVGSGEVIKGFDEGAKGMAIGEERVIEIPPEEAYGTDPNAHPLGNKTLFFKILLRSVQ